MATKKALVDTGIQVMRLLTEKWRVEQRDSIWQDVEPLTSCYGLMEFEERVFVVFDYFISVLEEAVSAKRPGAKLDDRINEVLASLTQMKGTSATDELLQLAMDYAKGILAESARYVQGRSMGEVIAQLRSDRDSLEEFGLRQYSANGVPRMMECVDLVNCRGGHSSRLTGAGWPSSACRTDHDVCNVADFLSNPSSKALLLDIVHGTVKVSDPRLREGARQVLAALGAHQCTGRSIGRDICLSVAACVLVIKAHACAQGMVSTDEDRIRLARHLALPVWPL
jgi:hypothetical protein